MNMSSGDDKTIAIGHEEPVNLKNALEERYLAYALSTIMHRALPDARDGLKPVHRRILHAMRLLKLDPDAAFKKCARIVGDVIGKYHPHGDQSVYDALVRLAQDFSQRYPLVDGQGNFGNIDGDTAAAYRYTEARMTEVSRLLLDGMDEEAVDFRATYNEEDEEPIVLPAAFPNLLANGSQGIAVGMATSIPPHNAAELCDAAVFLINKPEATVADLMQFVIGPDFPTGGICVESPASMQETYETGRGGFRLRSRWHAETPAKSSPIAVITEIPYGVSKGKMLEKIGELINDKKLPLINDMRDESAEDIRLIFEPKTRTIDLALMMESLFKLTELEQRIPMNLNVLVKGQVPRVLSLVEALREWTDHRREVLIRRSQHRLAAIDRRLEILEGFLIAYLNLDEVIRIVRYEDNPKASLMSTFSLTDLQAESILNMRLRSLAKLEEFEIRREHKALSEEKDALVKLLGSSDIQWKTVIWEIGEVKKTYGKDTVIGKRRTTFGETDDSLILDAVEALIEREPLTVVVSQKGWIRALKGHISDLTNLQFKAEDSMKFSFHTQTTEKITLWTANGKAFTLDASKLPGGRGTGEPISLMVDLENDVEIVDCVPYNGTRSLLLVSKEGKGFRLDETDTLANTRKGKQIMNCDDSDRLLKIIIIEGDHAAVIGENRKLLCFPLDQIPVMARGKGVRLQRYKEGGVSDMKTFALDKALTWLDTSGRTWSVEKKDLTEWLGNRAESGRLPPKGFPKNNRF
jgi:topoisomerase IV subunit A